jgi:hypothetical protein
MVCQWFGHKTTAMFFSLGLKTKVDGLVIWASKSPWWFLSLSLKTKWEEVCQFAPQNRERMKMVWGHALTSGGLLYQKVSHAMISHFASKLVKSDGGWCTWHHHRGCVEVKQKMAGSMVSGAAQWKSDQTTFHYM